jgi:hypothetical protein
MPATLAVGLRTRERITCAASPAGGAMLRTFSAYGLQRVRSVPYAF